MVCDVCTNINLVEPNATGNENNLLTCQKCSVQVHQLCYGVPAFKEPWLCSFCNSNGALRNRKCDLCPSTDGAFKRTTTKTWVHVVCAMFHRETIIKNVTKMEPVDLSRIPPRRSKCGICGDGAGICVPCAAGHKKCQKYLHATCAQSIGSLAEKYENDGISFNVFCASHAHKCAHLTSEGIKKNIKKKQDSKVLARKSNSSWLIRVNVFLWVCVCVYMCVCCVTIDRHRGLLSLTAVAAAYMMQHRMRVTLVAVAFPHRRSVHLHTHTHTRLNYA